MIALLIDNLANILVTILLLGIVALCIRSIYKDHKSGDGCMGCAGCSSKGCTDNCTHYGEKLNIK